MNDKLYKFLENGKSCHGGEYAWSLPVKNDDGTWTPGEWTVPVEGELELCENGYHLARAADVMEWLREEMYEAETDGEIVEDKNKVVVRRCRLTRRVETCNPRTLRLFAVWCARKALKLIDNPDPRSIAACDVAVRYANGEATNMELAAARDAAWDAAWDTAWDATRDAAWAAARATTRAAAMAAAMDTQTIKLFEMLGE